MMFVSFNHSQIDLQQGLGVHSQGTGFILQMSSSGQDAPSPSWYKGCDEKVSANPVKMSSGILSLPRWIHFPSLQEASFFVYTFVEEPFLSSNSNKTSWLLSKWWVLL